MIDALKDILVDACVIATPEGMKICSMDQSETIFVFMRLNADKFESYKCDVPMFNLGLNIQNMFKIMKNMSNTDILTWRVWRESTDKLEIITSNVEKGVKKTIHMNLLEMDYNDMKIPPVEFQSIITIPSPDFQKVCRDMSFISDTIEIQSVSGQLVFRSTGDFADMETVMGSGGETSEMRFIHNDNQIIQGFYNLKHLCHFTKCANLCNNIELYLRNDFPLFIQFQIGSLGYLKLGLTPKINPKALE